MIGERLSAIEATERGIRREVVVRGAEAKCASFAGMQGIGPYGWMALGRHRANGMFLRTAKPSEVYCRKRRLFAEWQEANLRSLAAKHGGPGLTMDMANGARK